MLKDESRSTATRQIRKRLATRQKISDAATRLFITRGFDQVTIEEIAEAADVSRMTVFNHFPRKEDMFFDLDQQARADLLDAIRQRKPGTSPVEALRLFVHRAVREQRPYANFFHPGNERFVATVRASEALQARARAIRDELSEALAIELAHAVRKPPHDPAAALAASLLLATWTVALIHAHAAHQRHGNVARAKRILRKLVDQGTQGVEAALAGTPYV